MLDFINYPVSFILWCWHKVFGAVFGPTSGVAWLLGIVFLTFTVRAILIKPFVKQVRSMRKMQEFAPEIKKLQAKYKNDRQKLAQEMQKLQSQHGVNPLGGCLPMLLQIPVFFGLNNVLRGFTPGAVESGNYYFGGAEVQSYLHANLFGARLSNFIAQPAAEMTSLGGNLQSVIFVSAPLMVIASIATHFTAKHNVARQNPATATAQTGIMNKITLWVFPLGVLVFGAFFPIGLLLYWLSNNIWTLGQQYLIYKKIDREEEEKKVAAVEKRNTLGPKVGQKPTQPKKRPVQPKPATGETETTEAAEATEDAKQDPKPAARKQDPVPRKTTTPKPGAKPAAKPASNGGTKVPGLSPDRSRSKKSGRKRP